MELIFKGTKGPWSANSANTVFSEDMCMICEVNGENCDKRKANAKLIAAAPELLEALQEIVDVLPSLTPPHQDARYKACLAINKAMGRG